MRRVIDELRARNEFQIVDRKVTGYFELAAVCQASQRKSEAPILFQQVDDSQFKVVTNLYGSRERLCRLIGADDGKFCRQWVELINSGGKAKNQNKVKSADIKRQEINLMSLPQITYQEKDAGPYITSGIFLAKDPNRSIPNLSFHRAMHVDDRELRIRLGTSHHLTHYQLEAEKQNEALEVAILIGAPTPYVFAAAASIPKDESEVEVANRISSQEILMRKCQFIDLEVPAETEVIIEGRILPNIKKPEGPFGEFKGNYIPMEDNHVVEVLGVTARENPYYHSILCGSTEDMRLLEVSIATQVYKRLSETLPGIIDVACVPNIMSTVVQIDQKYDGHARQVMLTAFGTNHDFNKSCIVVDEDVNLNDFADVYWACMMRASAQNDVLLIPDVPGFYRDPEKDHWGRLGIDATKPWGRQENFERTLVPGSDSVDLNSYFV